MRISLPDARFEVLVSSPSENVELGFEATLFNQPAYQALQETTNLYAFYLIRKSTGKADGVFFVSIQENIAQSPYRAPYGAAEFSETTGLIIVEDFLKAVLEFLQEKGIRKLLVKSYPFCYAPLQSALLTNSFLQLGFQLELSQLNHHIPVSEKSFASHLHLSEKRRLKKCHQAGFIFQQEEHSFLPDAYAFIKACRIEKKKPLSLSLEQLQQLFTEFPERYLIFSVNNEEEIAAVTVAVKVRSDILLTVYPASPYSYNAYSPSVMLNEGLYNYCRENEISMLDLGISGVKEDPHYSLMQYKENLGGVASLKLRFTWNTENAKVNFWI